MTVYVLLEHSYGNSCAIGVASTPEQAAKAQAAWKARGLTLDIESHEVDGPDLFPRKGPHAEHPPAA